MAKSTRLLSLTLALLMITGLHPALSPPTLAAEEPIVATLVDNGNTGINFGGASDSATIGDASNAEREYDLKVVLTYPSTAAGRSATITLAQGLKFKNDASAYIDVSPMLEGLVVNLPNTAPYGLGVSMDNTGSKTYQFKSGIEKVTLNLTIQVDNRFWPESIANAVTVTSRHDGAQESTVVLESLTVSYPGRTLHTGSGTYSSTAATDTPIDIVQNYRAFLASLSAQWTVCPVFYKNFAATVTIDSKVIVTSSDSVNWAMTESDNRDGTNTYTFLYNNGGPGLLTTLHVPVVFEFPSADFNAGETITGRRSASATFVGDSGETAATWPSRDLNFSIASAEVDVFVNFETITAANTASSNGTGMGANASASTGSTSPTHSGVLGWYSIGNAGGDASGPQVVELNFDREKLGVLGVALAIPAGQSVTKIDYKTGNNSSWQTQNVSLTANASQYIYVSWATLGIVNHMETGSYITALRYQINSLPGAEIIGMKDSNTVRTPIYGVTLDDGVRQIATSTLSLYSPEDAASPDKWITGNIYSDHTKSYASLGFANPNGTGHPPAQSKTAGETFGFSHLINPLPQNWVSNALRNNAVERPILYLRSETGNPITNIKLVNSRNVDLTDDLGITSELASDGALVYRIDTAEVPGNGAAIAHSAVLPNGGTANLLGLKLTYDICTKLTDSGTYRYADMLFVETPAYNISPALSSYAEIVLGPGPFPGIGSDGGRVWWMPAAVTDGYTIASRADITVSLSAKREGEDDSAYATWTQGADPVFVDVGSNCAVDILLEAVNNSGVEVTKPTIIYLPVPKKGDDWGEMMHSGQAFEFSMLLKNSIAMPGEVSGSVSYGNIIPTDDGAALNNATFSAWDPSAAASYNCIKIELTQLPNSRDPIRFALQMAPDPQTPGMADGLVNIWRPYYYEDLTNANNDEYKQWAMGAYLAAATHVASSYNIFYENLNGAANSANPSSYTYAMGVASFVDPATREGYTFLGWYDAETGGTEVTSIGDTAAGDRTLYARWATEQYTVTYAYNGADGNIGALDQVVAYGAAYGALPTPSRIGHTFGGWYLDAGFTTEIDAATVVTKAGDHSLYAKWIAEQYTVTYAYSGADGNIGALDQVVAYGAAYGALPTPSRIGHTFGGWYLDTAFTTGVSATTAVTTAGDHTLYARWIAEQYTVTYAYNGADGNIGAADQSVAFGAAYGALPAPSKAGHTFGGWYLDTAFTTGVSATTAVTTAGDHTLYARWAVEARSVVGGTVKDDAGNVLKDVTVTIMHSGNKIAEDKTGADGKFSFENLPLGRYNLVAEHTDGSDPGNPIVTVVTQILMVTGDAAADLTIVVSISQGRKNSVFVHDKNVHVDAVDGLHDVYTAAEGDHNTDDSKGITLDDLGILQSGGEITIYLEAKETDAEQQAAEFAAVEANAQGNNKIIGYALDLSAYKTVIDHGGAPKLEDQKLDELNRIVTIYIPLPEALQGRQGYAVCRHHGSLVEWITETSAPEYFELSRDGKTLMLHVKKFSVYAIVTNPVIRFDPISGIGTMADIHVAGGSHTLPACAFTREGYRFTRWNTKADGSGLSYADQSALSGIADDITLYAQWSASSNISRPSSGGGGGGGSGSRLVITAPVNGTVTANPANPPAGTQGTLAITPDTGYELESLTLTDGLGNTIPYTKSGGTVTFTMPQGTATVTATFAARADPDRDSDVSGLLITDDHIAYVQGRDHNRFEPQAGLTRAEVAQIFYNLLRDKHEPGAGTLFPDVREDAWYAAAVNTLASLGMISGFPDGSYHPDDLVTRAQFAAIVVRFAKAVSVEARFTDVPESHWAYDSVNTAAHFGWVRGVGNTVFAPDRPIERAEAVAMVNRMLRRYPGKATIDRIPGLIHFSDEDREHWAYYDIMEAANTHVYTREAAP